jgi:hypothetical protein
MFSVHKRVLGFKTGNGRMLQVLEDVWKNYTFRSYKFQII